MLTIPRVIGHRGARNHAPENTLAGIRTAHAQGARWVEVDVKLTRDGVPILMHDDTVDRTTDGSGAVRDMDFADIRRLDAGIRCAPRFAGERIPTLEEFLTLVAELELGVNLEIKPCPGREVETARVALEMAHRLWPAGQPAPLVSSFEIECLEEAQRARPEWPRGLLIDEPTPDWRALADRLDVRTINVNGAWQSARTVDEFRASGRPVLVYTVNDPAQARTLFDWGVSAVFTDTPPEILAVAGN